LGIPDLEQCRDLMDVRLVHSEEWVGSLAPVTVPK